jgi:Ca2+-binding EF-hand superfamily protein
MAGLRLLIPFLALPLLSASAAAQDYRAWDRNNDGVITRSEWRGTFQQFRERDVNRDGVLSGNELRQDIGVYEDDETFVSYDRNGNGLISRGEWRGTRAEFNRADRNGDNQISRGEFLNANAGFDNVGSFDALDDNGSGRIERNEWNGPRPAFNRLDLNRDGVLSRREFASADVALDRSDRANVIEENVVVDAQQQWMDTGIHVNAGDFVSFRADGTIQMTTGTDDRATPSGSLSGRTASNAPRPDIRAGTLLVRIGNGIEAYGANGSFTARRSGQLFFGVNDDHVLDNSGQYRVFVSVNPR